MSLKYFVKVGNVNNLSDARYCSAMGVNQLGFKLNDLDNNSSKIDNIKEIIGWINGVDTVAEFVNNDVEFINSIINIELFDFIQLNHKINIDDVNINPKRIIISINHIDELNEFFVDDFQITLENRGEIPDALAYKIGADGLFKIFSLLTTFEFEYTRIFGNQVTDLSELLRRSGVDSIFIPMFP